MSVRAEVVVYPKEDRHISEDGALPQEEDMHPRLSVDTVEGLFRGINVSLFIEDSG